LYEYIDHSSLSLCSISFYGSLGLWFHQIWKNFSHCFFRYFLYVPCSIFTHSETPILHILCHFKLSHNTLLHLQNFPHFFIFHRFYLCVFKFIIFLFCNVCSAINHTSLFYMWIIFLCLEVQPVISFSHPSIFLIYICTWVI
jgi:hypothetical protein